MHVKIDNQDNFLTKLINAWAAQAQNLPATGILRAYPQPTYRKALGFDDPLRQNAGQFFQGKRHMKGTVHYETRDNIALMTIDLSLIHI